MRSPDEQWVSGWVVGSGEVKRCVSGRGTSLQEVEWLSLLQQELEAAEPTVYTVRKETDGCGCSSIAS